mmetsp:Transcript_5328/g.16713  ORF Transcript_5328/g.16713 Transcript_5328/m.16713 type:complete len:238 (+) Transcript_5328:1963-2676(+)
MSRLRIDLYCSRCIGERPRLSSISFLGGRSPSTSPLTRRSKKGRSTLCSLLITSSSTSLSSRSNHSRHCSAEEKMSGSKKLSSAHSSCKLFCRGVPVISRRECDERLRSTCESRDCSFFIRCASSTITYRQANLRKAVASLVTISYDVTHTSNMPGCSLSAMSAARSSLSPWKWNALMDGAQLPSSRIQFVSVDFGAKIKKGPERSCVPLSQAMREMHCSVLPSPISSARMPFTPDK